MRAVAVLPTVVAYEPPRAAIPMEAEDRRVADDVDRVAVRAEARDRPLGRIDVRTGPLERRLEHGETCGLDGPVPDVLHHEHAVVEDHERVVGTRARKLEGALQREIRAEPMAVAPEHHVERAVRVRGHPARPERPGREIGRARERRERHRIEPLDPRYDRPFRCQRIERMPEHEELARLAEDEHRGRERVAAGHPQPLALAKRRPGQTVRRLRATRPAVLTGPRTVPVSPHVFGSTQNDESPRGMRGLSRRSRRSR